MPDVTMKQLLEAGVHFGHQRRRWNPKMARYIYTERNGIFIIDLKKTLTHLRIAFDNVRDVVTRGKSVLFVGTKKQGKDIIEEAARSCGMHWVNNRWLGGLLTNFRTIRRSVNRYIELEKIFEDGTINQYSKKEQSQLNHERLKYEKNLLGVKNMEQLPGAVFVVDTHKERIAVREARRMRIPVVAIVDTNCDPDMVDFIVPGNDDAIRSIKLVTEHMVMAVQEGLAARGEVLGVPAAEEEAAESKEEIEKLEEKYKDFIDKDEEEKEEKKSPRPIRQHAEASEEEKGEDVVEKEESSQAVGQDTATADKDSAGEADTAEKSGVTGEPEKE